MVEYFCHHFLDNSFDFSGNKISTTTIELLHVYDLEAITLLSSTSQHNELTSQHLTAS